jgi:hypothetical protein
MILRRHGVDIGRIERLDHRFLADVAEQSDLGPLAFRQRMLAAAEQDVGLDAQRGQFAHAMLRGLGLQLAGGRDIGHQSHMDEDGLAAAQLIVELADGLHERQALDIADGPADLAEHEVDIVGLGQSELLDLIGNVRNDLHRRAQIITAPLALDDGLVDAALRDIVGLTAGDAGEALIMAQVEIGLRAVVRHIDFAMLIGRHRARINVQIGIELAGADLVAACLQQRAERCCHEAFTKR